MVDDLDAEVVDRAAMRRSKGELADGDKTDGVSELHERAKKVNREAGAGIPVRPRIAAVKDDNATSAGVHRAIDAVRSGDWLARHDIATRRGCRCGEVVFQRTLPTARGFRMRGEVLPDREPGGRIAVFFGAD